MADDFVLPVEFTKREVEIFDYVWNNRLTMELKTGLTAAMLAAKHAVEADIPGDWVECGVWRGGVSLAAKLIFEEHRSAKSAWLFDTFAGMTEPGEHDRPKFEKYDTQNTFEQQQREDYNEWCHASVEDVRKNFERAGADLNGVHLVKGDVAETLADAANLPQQICVLRLDTDFYKGTRTELEILYPRLSLGGPILIGDVGYWEGVKRAVDEYFVDPRTRPLLYYTDLSDRMGVKVS
ncbi:MAG TPA: TylF/MycF/NovP-related O-methyltransferase [Bradyrhizobium sp.]|uniref:TylF/MycF/NovP-related O-methyltransferase n=1 Tax=Bradyrhizobium sp. TaxID=376 RepID=UPI002B46837F|nr:TylF/MycF/NovP-related O-methyltransferase [Bradyrhizobium sp.]HKO70749.1 TylF/MycF/NovP-related O-methyltransferase [Bradyrhizobium sp.]